VGAIIVVEADRVAVVLVAETFTQEGTAAQDSATLHIKNAEDRATLVEREALELVSWLEVENSTVLASACEDTEGLVWKIALFEDKLTRECWEQKMSEREHRARFEELTLLQTQGSELCHAIVGPPRAKHLSEGMQLAVLHHTKVAGELVAFRVVMSSAMKSVLRRLLGNTARMEVVGELVTVF
jgi:hypothetical protein